MLSLYCSYPSMMSSFSSSTIIGWWGLVWSAAPVRHLSSKIFNRISWIFCSIWSWPAAVLLNRLRLSWLSFVSLEVLPSACGLATTDLGLRDASTWKSTPVSSFSAPFCYKRGLLVAPVATERPSKSARPWANV